jgi:hypothetical protein
MWTGANNDVDQMTKAVVDARGHVPGRRRFSVEHLLERLDSKAGDTGAELTAAACAIDQPRIPVPRVMKVRVGEDRCAAGVRA